MPAAIGPLQTASQGTSYFTAFKAMLGGGGVSVKAAGPAACAVGPHGDGDGDGQAPRPSSSSSPRLALPQPAQSTSLASPFDSFSSVVASSSATAGPGCCGGASSRVTSTLRNAPVGLAAAKAGRDDGSYWEEADQLVARRTSSVQLMHPFTAAEAAAITRSPHTHSPVATSAATKKPSSGRNSHDDDDDDGGDSSPHSGGPTHGSGQFAVPLGGSSGRSQLGSSRGHKPQHPASSRLLAAPPAGGPESCCSTLALVPAAGVGVGGSGSTAAVAPEPGADRLPTIVHSPSSEALAARAGLGGPGPPVCGSSRTSSTGLAMGGRAAAHGRRSSLVLIDGDLSPALMALLSPAEARGMMMNLPSPSSSSATPAGPRVRADVRLPGISSAAARRHSSTADFASQRTLAVPEAGHGGPGQGPAAGTSSSGNVSGFVGGPSTSRSPGAALGSRAGMRASTTTIDAAGPSGSSTSFAYLNNYGASSLEVGVGAAVCAGGVVGGGRNGAACPAHSARPNPPPVLRWHSSPHVVELGHAVAAGLLLAWLWCCMAQPPLLPLCPTRTPSHTLPFLKERPMPGSLLTEF